MINKRPEPDTTEEIQNQIDSSEHPRHKDWVCLQIEPEGNRKPDEHIRESCYCCVDEDVGEEIFRRHFFEEYLIYKGLE